MTGTLLFDGAFGSYYAALTGRDAPCEGANLADPQMVLRIHREYIAAGAGAVKTNTFGVNARLLEDPLRRRALIEAGWELALRAARGTNVRVFADIGPIPADEGAGYLEAAETFLALGADSFLLETMAEITPLMPALALIRDQRPGADVRVSFAVDPGGYTRLGQYGPDLIDRAFAAGFSGAGYNCLCGPAHMVELVRRLGPRPGLTIMPNAGYAVEVGGRTVYRAGADYFARRMAQIHALGVTTLGGCCGTTPEHIRALAAALRRPAAPGHRAAAPTPPPPPRDCSIFGRKPLIAVEIDPPSVPDAAFVLAASRAAADAGADMVTLADGPLARARADSVVLAAKVRREIGIEVLPHMACRDRTSIAVKASLLGAAIEGIRQVLVVTGDPVPRTERQQGSAVYGFDAVSLMEYIARLNREEFAAAPLAFCGALNVNAVNFDGELRRAQRKAEAGAAALLTQPLSCPRGLENLRRAREALPCRLLAGILPFAGYRNAQFLRNEVAGIDIPEEIVEGLKGLPRQEVTERSLAWAKSLIDGAAPWCDGYYLMTPLTRIDLTAALTRYIRSKP